MKMRKIALVALLMTVVSSFAFADISDALVALQRKLDILNAQGYQLPSSNGCWAWTMNPQSFNQVERMFYAGNDYVLVATGDYRVSDVDIKVYDENWNLIDSDTDTSSIAVASFSPAWNGVFHVKVIYYSGRSPGSLGFFIAFK